MVLHNVANHARALVIRAARLDPNLLGHRDLHAVNIPPVPDRLEDPVRKAKDQDVLDRLLSQIVVDAIKLVLVEVLVDVLVQAPGRLQVAAKGLLDDHPGPCSRAGGPPHRACPNMLGDRRIHLGRRRDVEEPVPFCAVIGVDLRQHRIQLLVVLRGRVIALAVVQHAGELGPLPIVFQLGARVLLDCFQLLLAEGLVGLRFSGESHHRKVARQQAIHRQVV